MIRRPFLYGLELPNIVVPFNGQISVGEKGTLQSALPSSLEVTVSATSSFHEGLASRGLGVTRGPVRLDINFEHYLV